MRGKEPMSDAPSDLPPPELEVLVDLELHVAGERTDADRQKLQAAFTGTRGIHSVDVSGNRALLRYNPEEIREAEMQEVIRRTGFQVAKAEAAPAKPPVHDESGSEMA